EPFAKRSRYLCLCAGAVQGVDRLTFIVQRNKSARRLLVAEFCGNYWRQQAFGAGVRPGGILEIQTARRIFKNVRGTPWRTRRASIPALFQEFQLEPQDVKDVAVFMWHVFMWHDPTSSTIGWRRSSMIHRTEVTNLCDQNNS